MDWKETHSALFALEWKLEEAEHLAKDTAYNGDMSKEDRDKLELVQAKIAALVDDMQGLV